jgi:hypothetical protein
MSILNNYKADSSAVIWVLLVIGIIVAASIVIFWKWKDLNNTVTNEFNCKIKQQSYCLGMINKENPNWDEIAPKTGCDKYNVVKPDDGTCKRLFG